MSDARVLEVDPNALTLGDVEDVEDYCGKPIGEILKPDVPLSAKAMTALAWVVLRRQEPGISIDQVRELQFANLDVRASEADPTSAAGSDS